MCPFLHWQAFQGAAEKVLERGLGPHSGGGVALGLGLHVAAGQACEEAGPRMSKTDAPRGPGCA